MPIMSLLLAAILWGTIGPVAKYAFVNGMTPIDVAFWRGLIGGLFFLFEAFYNRSITVAKKDIFPLILFSLIGVLGLEATNLLCVQLGGAGFASILLYSAPIWVFIFSVIFLNEKITKKKIIALILALIGVIGISFTQLTNSNVQIGFWAVLCGLVSGISYASFYLFGKIYFHKYNAFTLYGYAFPLASILLLPYSNIKIQNSQSIIVILYMGIPATYLAYRFYSWGLKRIEATKASVITMIEPLVAVILGTFIWSETLSLMQIGFGFIILLGIYLIH